MMDNCLASNSETGGVGCDNMTMIVVGLLRGKTKEEWYDEIGKRVANGDGPCAPPEYADFRGPGVHHNFDDSDSGYDVDMDQKKGFGSNQRGRIILLGDGTEVLTDSDDTEMFDHSEEDRDLASQVHKGEVTGQEQESKSTPKENPAQTESQYKGVAEEVLPKSTESTIKEGAATHEVKDK